MIEEYGIHVRFEELQPFLNEHKRQLFAANEATSMCYLILSAALISRRILSPQRGHVYMLGMHRRQTGRAQHNWHNLVVSTIVNDGEIAERLPIDVLDSVKIHQPAGNSLITSYWGITLLKNLTRIIKGKSVVKTVEIETSSDLLEQAFWIDPTPIRMKIPPGMLRMQGGFVYGHKHPFVRAIDLGRDTLKKFYQDVCPETISEYYGISPSDRLGADLPPWEIPWYGRAKRSAPPGEAGLGPEHGVSFFGPATDKKIDTELARLLQVSESIRTHGYMPDRCGDIEGYIIKSGNQACFFVRGGKHRAAVLTSHGFSHIPVMFRSTFPRVIDAIDVACWPLVAARQMDASLSREILDVYIQGTA